MSNLLIWILLLAIWNSILFFGKDFGISVILFIIPLLIFIYYVLKSNKMIKNKNGLLFMVPICLLSLTYFLFNNSFFNIINIFVIILLFILMYIYTMRPTFNMENILEFIGSIIIEPMSHMPNVFHVIAGIFKNKFKLSNDTKKVLKSVLIVLPIVVVVLILLASADQIFEGIFREMFSVFDGESFFDSILIFIERLVFIVIIFFYLAATINFLLYNFSKRKIDDKKNSIKIDDFTIKLLLTVLNIIYVVFDIIQIRSLLLHQVSMDISYAEYAREGFFQLMFVSFINLVIILISKFAEDKKEIEKNMYIKIMNLLMVFLTFIIIISSFMRMYMYESEFGYTLLRLLVYITLITEIILLIPTIIYIVNSKFNIVKAYMIILISVYTFINFINVDYIIAYRNINRYYDKNDIDLLYLKNDKTDNIPVLVDLYKSVEDKEIKDELDLYFKCLDTDINGFQEFNISKNRAMREITSVK